MGREAIFISTRSVVDLQKKVCLFLTVQPALQIISVWKCLGTYLEKKDFNQFKSVTVISLWKNSFKIIIKSIYCEVDLLFIMRLI